MPTPLNRRPAAASPSAVEPLEGRTLFAAVPVTVGTPLSVEAHQPQRLAFDTIPVTATKAARPTLKATVAWGDGTRSAATLYTVAGTDGSAQEYPVADHAYARPGHYAVRVAVTAGHHVVGRLRTTATVAANPTTAVALTARAGVAFDAVLATYTAAQPLVPATQLVALDNSDITWGDGTASGGTLVQRTTADGQNVVEIHATHTYAKPGHYAVTVSGTVIAAGDGTTPVNALAMSIPITAGTAVVRR